MILLAVIKKLQYRCFLLTIAHTVKHILFQNFSEAVVLALELFHLNCETTGH